MDWDFKYGEEKKVLIYPSILSLEKKCNTADGPKGNNIRLGIVCSSCTWWKGMVDGKKRDNGSSEQESILLQVQNSPNTAKVYC